MSNETRRPSGAPNGGQFAATAHSEATVDLIPVFGAETHDRLLGYVAQIVDQAGKGESGAVMGLARIRRALTDAGYVEPSKDPAQIDAPFAGTDLDRSPAAATSHLRAQGGGGWALILHERMLTPAGSQARPGILLDSSGQPQVWLAGDKLTGFGENVVWRRIAAGSDLTIEETKAEVARVLKTAPTEAVAVPSADASDVAAAAAVLHNAHASAASVRFRAGAVRRPSW